MIQWSGNDGRGHISRSKIKDMCIMPPFVMRDILKVIRASETAEAVIPLWEVIPGEYEEYAHQVLNSNARERKDFLTVIFLIDHLEVEIFIGSWSINCRS